MSYGYIYVAQVAMGSSDMQTLRAFREADAFDGPSLILAYSPCINHGYDLTDQLSHQDMAVKSGLWPLYRYNPNLIAKSKNPLNLDSKAPSIPVKEAAYTETRYSMLTLSDEGRAEQLMQTAQADVNARWELYQQMASMSYDNNDETNE